MCVCIANNDLSGLVLEVRAKPLVVVLVDDLAAVPGLFAIIVSDLDLLTYYFNEFVKL